MNKIKFILNIIFRNKINGKRIISGTFFHSTINKTIQYTLFFYLPLILIIIFCFSYNDRSKFLIIILSAVFFPITFFGELIILSLINIDFDFLLIDKYNNFWINSNQLIIDQIESIQEKYYLTSKRFDYYVYYILIKINNKKYYLLEPIGLKNLNPLNLFKIKHNYTLSYFLIEKGLNKVIIKKDI